MAVYSNTTRARTTSGDGGGDSPRAKEDGVGIDPDFELVFDMVDVLLDTVDALDESVEPLVRRLDPVQVAGIYGTRFNSAIRPIYVPGAHLELAFSMDRHSTKFARLSQFAETPDRSLE